MESTGSWGMVDDHDGHLCTIQFHPAQEAEHMHIRRLYSTCLLLTALCLMLWIQQAAAMLLDPHSFASLGAFPTTPGTYQIDTTMCAAGAGELLRELGAS